MAKERNHEKGVLVRLLILLMFLWPAAAEAVFLITGSDLELLPDTADQVRVLKINHNDSFTHYSVGINLEAQVADGGPEAGGSIRGPAITGINLIGANSLFEFNHGLPGGSGQIVPQVFERGVLTGSGTVDFEPNREYSLAELTFDTTGFSSPQSWSLSLNNTLNGESYFILNDGSHRALDFSGGTITVVPEVSGGFWLGIGLFGFAVYRRCRKSLRFVSF